MKSFSRALPIVLGYIPVGFAFGVLAQQAGLSEFNTLLMSIVVYAGSSQLIAVSLFSLGTPALSIIITTFIVNLRHLLFSAAISPYLKGWNTLSLTAFSYEITDESFAIHSISAQYDDGKPIPLKKTDSFIINITAHCSWILGTWLGISAGQLIQDVEQLALDFVLPAMFIALIILQVKDHYQIAVAFIAGILSTALLLLGINNWNIVLSTLLVTTIGVFIEQWSKKEQH